MRKILAPLLLMLLAIPLTTVVYGYDARYPSTSTDTTGDRTTRIIDVYTAPDGSFMVIRSGVRNGSTENHFGLLVSTYRLTDYHLGESLFTHGLVIHVAFSQETDIGDVENEAFLHIRIAYLALTEFTDTNGNGALDSGVDTVVKTIPLNVTYTPLEFSPIVSEDGKHGWEIRAITMDGMFGVTADIFPQYAVVNGTIVPPTTTKITTMINNFPFADAGNKVALRVMAQSKMVLEHETPTLEERLRVRSATAQGFYTWALTADVDGITRDVTASTTRLDSGRWIINLAYPQGTSIVHDPILGFDFGATPLLTGRLLIGAAVAAIAVFGILVYLGRRQLVRVFNPKPLVQ